MKTEALITQSISIPFNKRKKRHKIDLIEKSRQHPDFPGGHPPEYYPSLRLLNFTERTGYGVLSLRWPSTTSNVYNTNLILPNINKKNKKKCVHTLFASPHALSSLVFHFFF